MTGRTDALHEIDWRADPATIVNAVAAASDRHETPCGSGTMVWRRWGHRRSADAFPLVLLHGGSGSWTHWIKVIPALSRITELWIPDLPGLGDSAMPPAPHVPATCGQIVADGARKLIPHGPLHLLAFSFGAHVGTFAAAYLGDRLATFTICGSAALGLPHNRLDFDRLRNTMTPAEAALVHRTNLARLMFWNPSRIDDLAVYTQSENIRRARFKSRPFAGTGEIPATLPHVTAALRAIWGANDVLATPDVETRYAVLRRHHPELQTRTIPDAGHWVAYEQPDAFVEAALALTSIAS